MLGSVRNIALSLGLPPTGNTSPPTPRRNKPGDEAMHTGDVCTRLLPEEWSLHGGRERHGLVLTQLLEKEGENVVQSATAACAHHGIWRERESEGERGSGRRESERVNRNEAMPCKLNHPRNVAMG